MVIAATPTFYTITMSFHLYNILYNISFLIIIILLSSQCFSTPAAAAVVTHKDGASVAAQSGLKMPGMFPFFTLTRLLCHPLLQNQTLGRLPWHRKRRKLSKTPQKQPDTIFQIHLIVCFETRPESAQSSLFFPFD